MPQLKMICPGCGEYTLERTGHLISMQYHDETVHVYCPKQDKWFYQGTFIEVKKLIPDAQQLGLL